MPKTSLAFFRIIRLWAQQRHHAVTGVLWLMTWCPGFVLGLFFLDKHAPRITWVYVLFGAVQGITALAGCVVFTGFLAGEEDVRGEN